MSARSATTGPGLPPFRMPTTPVPRDAGLHLHAQGAQVVRDDLRGADFLQPQLGMLVEVAAPGDDLRQDLGGRAIDCRGHRIRGRLGQRQRWRDGEQHDEHDT